MEIRLDTDRWLRPRLLTTGSARAVLIEGTLDCDDPHRPLALVDRLQPDEDGCRYRLVDGLGEVDGWCRAADQAYQPCSRRVIDALRRLGTTSGRDHVHQGPDGRSQSTFLGTLSAGLPDRSETQSLRVIDATITPGARIWLELGRTGRRPFAYPGNRTLQSVWLSIEPVASTTTLEAPAQAVFTSVV